MDGLTRWVLNKLAMIAILAVAAFLFVWVRGALFTVDPGADGRDSGLSELGETLSELEGERARIETRLADYEIREGALADELKASLGPLDEKIDAVCSRWSLERGACLEREEVAPLVGQQRAMEADHEERLAALRGELEPEALENDLQRVRERIFETRAAIGRTQGSGGALKWSLAAAWARTTRLAPLLVGLVLFLPATLRALWYFLALPALAKRPRRRAVGAAGSGGGLDLSTPGTAVSLRLGPGDRLVVRPGWADAGTSGSTTKVRRRWRTTAPLLGRLAGLRDLEELRTPTPEKGEGPAAPADIQVRPPARHSEEGLRLIRLDLIDHPGVVVRMGAIVAVSDSLKLKTRSLLADPGAWAVPRWRWALLAGTGSVVLAADDGLLSEPADRADPRRLLAFDGRLAWGPARSSRPFRYLLGFAPGADLSFEGDGICVLGAPAGRGPFGLRSLPVGGLSRRLAVLLGA